MNKKELYKKIELGCAPILGKTILHTAPHHDDILLGYFPYAVRNLQGNDNHVLYITSGANGVSDQYLAQNLFMTHQQVAQFDDATKNELKSVIRESESEQKWALVAGDAVKIKHLRSQFYDASPEEFDAAMSRDIARVVAYLQEIKPDIITMLVDPVGIGPSTHYTTQQIIEAAIAQINRSNIEIIGYRNVWSSFDIEQASMIVPIIQAELATMESIFINCFASQKNKFIINDDDGQTNFAEQAAHIQKAQYSNLLQILESDETNRAACLFLKKYQAALFLQQL